MPKTAKAVTLPNEEELEALWQLVAKATEKLDETVVRYAAFVQPDAGRETNDADLGRLRRFIVNMRLLLVAEIVGSLDRLEWIADHELIPMVEESPSGNPNSPTVDERGRLL